METYPRPNFVNTMSRLSIIIIAVLGFVYTCAAQSDSLIHVGHLSYDILYNTRYNCPSVVFWVLQMKDLGRFSQGQHIPFMEDLETPRPRVKSSDYSGTGFHRGHLCPAGDRGSTYEKWFDTFFMSNVAPMTPRLNTGSWKAAEDECRSMVKTGCHLLITAIPLWIDSISPDIGKTKIRVPSHFYKKALCVSHQDHVIHWLMRNTQDKQSMPSCVITADSARSILQNVRTSVFTK